MKLPPDAPSPSDHTPQLEGSKAPSERSFFTGDGFSTLRRLKSGGGRRGAPPLPCLPPPGVPQADGTPCYCASPDSTYSEAHYTATQRLPLPPHYHHHLQQQQLQQLLQQPMCATHVYASTNPLPPCPSEGGSARWAACLCCVVPPCARKPTEFTREFHMPQKQRAAT
ncbi:hypothetical protein FHG87_022365 [Trinorchestia longiramus]|nr:hypothetical protein FHG87_022365 [Trinorchestia longiramus]